MVPSIRLLLVPVLIAVTARDASAQRFAFQQIPWRISADSVRTLMRAQGFTPGDPEEDGDLEFRREDGARAFVQFQEGRLIGITLIDPAPGEQVAERYRVVADSLRSVLGPPDEADEEDYEWTLWVSGLASVEMHVYQHAGQPYLQVAWYGPGWYDEMSRRGDVSPQPTGFTIVSQSAFMRMAVDTANGPRGTGTLRGRFRIEYFQPITPKVNGVDQDPLDAVEYEMDFDCADRRTRLIARLTYLEGRRTRTDRPESQQVWSVPQPDGHYARGLDAVCRVARGIR